MTQALDNVFIECYIPCGICDMPSSGEVVLISRIDAKTEISPFVAAVVIVVVLAVAAAVALYPMYSKHVVQKQPTVAPPDGSKGLPLPPVPNGGAVPPPAQPAQPNGGAPAAPSPGKG